MPDCPSPLLADPPAPERPQRIACRARALGLVSGLLAVFFALPGQAQSVVWHEQDGIGWACGGIGYEERQSLRALESRGNVGLLFVVGTRGGLIADVRLRIVSSSDATRGLEVVAEGPQCVLQLPIGEWRLDAGYGQSTRDRTFSVRAAAPAPLQRIQIAFPGETAGAHGVSPEEASQVGDWGKVGR